ncbi:uncharacterized protein LOC126902840 isoform X2 [Daktulosphaira vitifoliae]|uniref:uncharacterized protein LOC126902840 isoform X2 n=1 Tax=Daktulosphaira vitifoliae TaxID=58002 RepID=UPI0021A9DDBD|nr:uncharacterized protein LOC126902840 isoform X2 [Daktulosphaira vitifoliae]XP_050536458.1 uncharacterized protein LOC126902840 isoform X2 [Daktulosphaira vitifoliae]
MNYYCKIHTILLKVILLNVISVYTNDEFSQNTENQTSITIDDLNILIREYPAFLQLKLQKQEYYTDKDIARCPMPYNENTILDDPDVVKFDCFNPRKCKKPWTWTCKNEIDVPVPINGTVGKKLGDIIGPCIKNNTNIIQCYTHYLNVIESVGLTFVDRFCLFEIEIWDRMSIIVDKIDYIEKFSLFNIKTNMAMLSLIVVNFKELLDNIYVAFKQYYISTLPLDCIANVMKKMFENTIKTEKAFQKFREQYVSCRYLLNSKRNYAILVNDQYWEWDITSDCKPDDTDIMTTQYKNDIIGLKLFPYKVPK